MKFNKCGAIFANLPSATKRIIINFINKGQGKSGSDGLGLDLDTNIDNNADNFFKKKGKAAKYF